MASYLLLNQQIVQFSGMNHLVKIPFAVRTSSAKLDLSTGYQDAAKASFVQRVLERQGKSQLKSDLCIKIMMPDTLSSADNAAEGIGIMKLKATGENHIFNQICSMTHEKVTLSWVVSEFGEVCESKANRNGKALVPSLSWKTQGVQLNRSQSFIFASGVVTFNSVYSSMREIPNIPVPIITSWKNRKPFQGTFSVIVVTSKTQLSREIGVGRQHFKACRKMLDQCIETDVHLVSKETVIIKCHRAMLAVSSDKLANLLKTKTLQFDCMKHLSLECIQALLAFIYYKDVSKVNERVKFAVEVLGAAMEFQVIGLAFHIQEHLESKSDNEFTVEEGVKLYVIAKLRSSENISINDDANEDEDGNQEDTTAEVETRDSEIETETDDDSEPCVIWQGITTRSNKRMRTEENGRVQSCTPVRQNGKNLAVLRQSSGNGNGAGALASDEPIPGTSTSRSNPGAFLYNTNLIEKQAIKIILRCLKNNPSALEESVEYHKLIGSPKLLLEISKIIIQSSQGNERA